MFVAKNKTLTVDNLAKRRKVEDQTCLVCSEPLPVLHVFFKYFFVVSIWTTVFEKFLVEFVACLWVSEIKNF